MTVEEIAAVESSSAADKTFPDKNYKKFEISYYDENYVPSKTMRHLGKIWDTFGKEPHERSLVFKLDIFLFLYGILAYIVKSLDTSNISNAYVSGMKEDVSIVQTRLISKADIS